jgi:hypothetical protein
MLMNVHRIVPPNPFLMGAKESEVSIDGSTNARTFLINRERPVQVSWIGKGKPLRYGQKPSRGRRRPVYMEIDAVDERNERLPVPAL